MATMPERKTTDRIEISAPTAKPTAMDVMVAAFGALGYALSARALLLLALIGAFVLAVMAMLEPSVLRLAVLGAFAVGAVGPVTILEIRKGRSDGR